MSGIYPLELGWRNFLSYGNNLTIIALNFSKPTVISGRNLDSTVEGNLDTNGAGKTTIMNALSYALYDETISDIKVDDLINWVNNKNMEVYVIFQKGDLFYKVERFRKFSKKGGTGVRILESSVNDGFTPDNCRDITQAGRANKQLVDILGIPFDVFCRVVLFSSATPSFFTLPASSASGKACQKGILEELFGYTEITQKSDSLTLKIKTDKKEIERVEELNAQILAETERLLSQIRFAETQSRDWDMSHIAEEQKLALEVQKLSQVDFDEEKLIFEQITKLEKMIQDKNLTIKEKQLIIDNIQRTKALYDSWDMKKASDIASVTQRKDALTAVNFDEQLGHYDTIEGVIAKRDALMKKGAGYATTKTALEKAIKTNEDELSHLNDNKCPYCLQDFRNVKEKIVSLNDANARSKGELDVLIPMMFEHDTDLSKLNDEIADTRKKLIFQSRDQVLLKKNELANLEKQLIDLSSSNNPHLLVDVMADDGSTDILKSEIAAQNAKIDKFRCLQSFSTEREMFAAESALTSYRALLESERTKANPHVATVNKLKGANLPDNKNKELEDMRDELEHAEFLYKLLTKKDSFIRVALLKKNLPLLNSRLKHHLDKTGLQHKVTFTDNMTAAITQFGTQISYGNLSTGQKARINLAVSFAFRDVLQTRHEKVNFCMLDEYLDSGLSNAGVGMAVKMIKEIARDEKIPVFIISNREDVGALFDSKVEVELNNKFSNIVRSDIAYSATA